MSMFRPNADWLTLWTERNLAVQRILGETTPPGEVLPFQWDGYVCPGACAMTFAPRHSRSHWLSMTLGLTQPIERGEVASSWEFCVRSTSAESWVPQLLYDLVTYYLSEGAQVYKGMYLPLVFFQDGAGKTCAGLAEDRTGLKIVGEMSGLYLWDDFEHLAFHVSTGTFGLMTAIGVTQEEDMLAQEATPSHLLLMLEQMGVGQVLDPNRQSVMRLPGALVKWKAIREMPHDAVIRRLQQKR